MSAQTSAFLDPPVLPLFSDLVSGVTFLGTSGISAVTYLGSVMGMAGSMGFDLPLQHAMCPYLFTVL